MLGRRNAIRSASWMVRMPAVPEGIYRDASGGEANGVDPQNRWHLHPIAPSRRKFATLFSRSLGRSADVFAAVEDEAGDVDRRICTPSPTCRGQAERLQVPLFALPSGCRLPARFAAFAQRFSACPPRRWRTYRLTTSGVALQRVQKTVAVRIGVRKLAALSSQFSDGDFASHRAIAGTCFP